MLIYSVITIADMTIVQVAVITRETVAIETTTEVGTVAMATDTAAVARIVTRTVIG